MQLEIEKLVYGGDGLARLSPAPGDISGRRQVVFIPGVLPGERVEARLAGKGKAELVSVLTPSPDRIVPGCEYFGRCGGCQWQHIAPARQLALKREILLETLQRLGGVAWEGEVATHSAPEWGYRNRVRLEIIAGGATGVGYHQRESHRLIPVTHCPIASPRLNAEIAALSRALPRRLGAAGDREVELVADNRDSAIRTPEAPVLFVVAGHSYRVSAGSFFQVNRFLAGDLVATVTATTGGGRDIAVDLFSGVGLFTLPLAQCFTTVEAVETHPAAVADLRHNTASLARVRVHARSALEFTRRFGAARIDLLVADPPRAGLGPELAAAIAALEPARIHLVACDPATLARDLKALVAAGYAIAELHLFDLFPQTYHLETVVKLVRS